MERFSKYRLLDSSLLELVVLLLRPLFFLLPLVLLGLGHQPVTHRILLAMPLSWRSRHSTKVLIQRMMRPTRVRECHGGGWRQTLQTTMRCCHLAIRRDAGPQRAHRRINPCRLRRYTGLRKRYPWREVMSKPAAKLGPGRL